PRSFGPARAAPRVYEQLWLQSLASYFDNPLPPLLKERLLASLARYCAAPYALVVHSCALAAQGATPAEVLALLEEPAPTPEEIEAAIVLMERAPLPL